MCRFIDWMIFTGYIMINNYETIIYLDENNEF